MPGDAQLLAELGIRALLWLLAVLVAIALAVTWVPQLHPSVCGGTTVLGLPTACVMERPTQATLDVLGIREASTVANAAHGAVEGGGQALGQLHEDLEQAGAGSSAKWRRSQDGMGAVSDALGSTP